MNDNDNRNATPLGSLDDDDMEDVRVSTTTTLSHVSP